MVACRPVFTTELAGKELSQWMQKGRGSGDPRWRSSSQDEVGLRMHKVEGEFEVREVVKLAIEEALPLPSLNPADFLGNFFGFICLCLFWTVLQIILHLFIVS